MRLSLIHSHRQGEILATKSKKCYPEWVVFFIYRNMALTSAPSGISENPETKELTNEAQKRVDTVAKNAVAVLDKNLDAQSAISKLFGEMVSNNLRDPKNIAKIQDGLYGARDERLSQASPTERLDILESFSTFMAKFTQ